MLSSLRYARVISLAAAPFTNRYVTGASIALTCPYKLVRAVRVFVSPVECGEVRCTALHDGSPTRAATWALQRRRNTRDAMWGHLRPLLAPVTVGGLRRTLELASTWLVFNSSPFRRLSPV